MVNRAPGATGPRAILANGDTMKHAYEVKAVFDDINGEKVVSREGRFERVRDIEKWSRYHFGDVELVYPGFYRLPGRNVAVYYQQLY